MRFRGHLRFQPSAAAIHVPTATPFGLTFIAGYSDATAQTTYTFNNVDFGAEDSTRRIVVAVMARDSGTTGDISSATIGGVSGTQVVARRNNASNTDIAAIYIVHLPNGTSGTVSVVFNEAIAACRIAVYALKGPGASTATDTGSAITSNPSVSLTIPAGGAAVACGVAVSSAAATLTNLTKDYEILTATSYVAGSNTSGSGATTLTFTFTAQTEPVGVFAAWGP